MAILSNAIKNLGTLFDLIPRGKRIPNMDVMTTTELALRQSAAVLDALRRYFLDTTGEASPFVQRIDELIDRKSDPKAKGG
jgi:hypothetical protein